MPQKYYVQPTIRAFGQPNQGYRKLVQNHEIVDYLPNSSFRIWYNTAGAKFDTHWHTAVEIEFLLKGACSITLDQQVYSMTPGDILIVPSGVVHTMEQQDGCELFVFLFELDDIIDLKGFTSLMPIMSKPIYLAQQNSLRDKAAAILNQCIHAYFNPSSFMELENYARILSLYALIGRAHFDSVKPTANTPIKHEFHLTVIQSAMDYIDMHYMDDITLDDIADKVGFSKFHFSRLFKQYTNTTFHQFLSMKRIDMADRLMQSSAASITEIAMQVGFTSIPTFNRVYRSIRNCTPSEYKALYQGAGAR